MPKKPLPPFECRYTGSLLAGVDEVGRGPLIGAVVTAAVILDPDRPIAGLADSKKLTDNRRSALYGEILEHAKAWSIGRCEAHEIDELNIYQATMLAMERAVSGLAIAPEYVLVDGNRCPKWHWPSEPVVKGDSRVEAISAASIIAKVPVTGKWKRWRRVSLVSAWHSTRATQHRSIWKPCAVSVRLPSTAARFAQYRK
jgi:ribonuclease HII